ncbi:hypothetical protein [Spiroplasma endosymbiont of Aleiodes alternator]|uniref:hypothetical protein n=1 Tax=Spiroplasma endosymbiont of Aleiodes alternator TaxID=3139329 RepID=UPI003CCAB085
MFKENIKKDLSKEEITNLLVDFDKDNIFQQNLEEKEIQELLKKIKLILLLFFYQK